MTEAAEKIFIALVAARRAREDAIRAMRESRGGLVTPEMHAFEKADDAWEKAVARFDTWIREEKP